MSNITREQLITACRAVVEMDGFPAGQFNTSFFNVGNRVLMHLKRLGTPTSDTSIWEAFNRHFPATKRLDGEPETIRAVLAIVDAEGPKVDTVYRIQVPAVILYDVKATSCEEALVIAERIRDENSDEGWDVDLASGGEAYEGGARAYFVDHVNTGKHPAPLTEADIVDEREPDEVLCTDCGEDPCICDEPCCRSCGRAATLSDDALCADCADVLGNEVKP